MAMSKGAPRSLMKLPEELVEEILCRVPATSLKRLRTSCKRWDSLYMDKKFARKHSENAPKEILDFMFTNDQTVCSLSIDLRGNTPSVNIIGKDVSLPFQYDVCGVFHCDGLLLCTSSWESTIVVWNPLTGKTRWIKAGDSDHTFVLGYYYQNNGSKSYKILCFKTGVKGYGIYEFDSDSWRIFHDDVAPGWDIDYSTQTVSLKGEAYLFARDKTEMHNGISLVRFDFSTDKFVHVPPPYMCDSYKTVAISVVREEKLSVILQQEDASETEVWVTNKIDDTKVVSWSKVLALALSPDLQISSLASSLLDEEKEVIVWCQKWEVEDENEDWNPYESDDERKIKNMIYVVGKDNKVTEEDFGDDTMRDPCWPALLNYVPSLDQIEL